MIPSRGCWRARAQHGQPGERFSFIVPANSPHSFGLRPSFAHSGRVSSWRRRQPAAGRRDEMGSRRITSDTRGRPLCPARALLQARRASIVLRGNNGELEHDRGKRIRRAGRLSWRRRRNLTSAPATVCPPPPPPPLGARRGQRNFAAALRRIEFYRAKRALSFPSAEIKAGRPAKNE